MLAIIPQVVYGKEEDELFPHKCSDNPDLTENFERCEGMQCDANYQCYSNNCNKDLKCAMYQTESKFNGILALIGFFVILVAISIIAINKLCRNRITRESLRE